MHPPTHENSIVGDQPTAAFSPAAAVSQTPPQIQRGSAQLWITASAWGSRLANMAVQLISMRLLLAGMGTDEYAVYALLSSLAIWYQLADLSIGSGLQNYVSEHRATGKDYHIYLRTAALAGVGLLLISLSLSWLASPWLAPLLLHQFAFLTAATQTRALLIVGTFFIISGVAGMGMRAWYALQKGHIANLLTLAASLATLFGTWWAMQADGLSHRLLWSLVALSAPPALGACASVVWVLAHEKSWGRSDLGVFQVLLKRGLSFWVSQILVMLLLKIDYILIAHTLKTHDMVVYNIGDRIFGAAFGLFTAATLVLWPVSAELIVQHKWSELARQIRSYLFLGGLFIFCVTLAFMILAPLICHILSPRETIVMPRLLIGFFGLFYLVNVWTTTYGIVLYSKSDLKPLMLGGAVQALIGPPLQWFLAIHFGLYGIVFGLFIVYLGTMAWILPYRLRQHMRQALI